MTRAFRKLLLEGVRRFAMAGYSSQAELEEWLKRLRIALEAELPDDDETHQMLTRTLEAIYERELRSGIAHRVPGIERYTLDRVAPHLRAELDRRIFAGVDLIRLNRQAAIEKTLQRFSGWVTSVPKTGTSTTDLRNTVSEIGKSAAQVKYEARRVAIDQGHKLSAAVAHVVAEQNGAIAGIWHDRGEFDHGYDARPVHLKRSGTVFLIRNSWAANAGLVKRGTADYTDEIEQPAELPYCSCYYEYITTPHDLPEELLSAQGRLWVAGEAVRHDSVHPDRAAASVLRDPSVAQAEAGNYRMGHFRMHGFDITLETARGNMRRGIGADGQAWEVIMPANYGYIRRTEGVDGEQIDCYIGPNPDAPMVWVIDQLDLASWTFDEQKAMLGFNTEREARDVYARGFSDRRGAERIGAVREMTVDEFKRQVRSGVSLLATG